MPRKETVRLSQTLLTYAQCDRKKEELLSFLKTLDFYECSIVAEEEHHATEGKHLHAWVKFENSMRMTPGRLNTMFDWDGKHPNIELVKNKKEDKLRVWKYVTKDGHYLEDNCNVDAMINPKVRGKKYNTLHILETDPETLVRNEEISANSIKNILWAQQWWIGQKKPPYTTRCRGIWIYGRAGCGKSTWAAMFGDAMGGYYEKPQNKWFDNYAGQRVIILDDLRTDTLNYYLLKWADNKPVSAEVKGGKVWLRHLAFIVTTNYPMEHYCRNKDGTLDCETYDAMKRRYTYIQVDERTEYLEYDPTFVWDVKECTLLETLCKKSPTLTDNTTEAPSDPTSCLDGSGYV